MTLNEVSQTVLEIINQPYDEVWNDMIKANIIDSRALLIRREYEKTRVFPDVYLSGQKCFKFEKANELDCCEFSCACPVNKSIEPLPELIIVKDDMRSMIKYVGSSDWGKGFGYIDPGVIPFIGFSRFTAHEPYWTIINKYVYIFNSPAKQLGIRGIFADPRKITACCSCSIPCFDPDGSLFIEGHLSDTLINMVLAKIRTKPETREVKIDE